MTPAETALRKIRAEVLNELEFRDGRINSEEAGWAFAGMARNSLVWLRDELTKGLPEEQPTTDTK